MLLNISCKIFLHKLSLYLYIYIYIIFFNKYYQNLQEIPTKTSICSQKIAKKSVFKLIIFYSKYFSEKTFEHIFSKYIIEWNTFFNISKRNN